MNLRGRSATSAVLVAAVLILAALAGVAISLASGDLQGKKPEPWTPPAPTAPPTGTPISSKSPSLSPTGTPTRTATPSPLPATATPIAGVAALTPAAAAITEPNTVTPTRETVATVKNDPLSLRRGPSTDAALIGIAQFGESFTVLGRSADDAWLKVCCLYEAPVWLAAQFVDLSAPMSSLPVVEP